MKSGNASRVERAKEALRSNVEIRSDGKPYTPPPLTREFFLALLEQAGRTGMTALELANEHPTRETPAPHILKSMEGDTLEKAAA